MKPTTVPVGLLLMLMPEVCAPDEFLERHRLFVARRVPVTFTSPGFASLPHMAFTKPHNPVTASKGCAARLWLAFRGQSIRCLKFTMTLSSKPLDFLLHRITTGWEIWIWTYACQ
jgi:hypothetical protein